MFDVSFGLVGKEESCPLIEKPTIEGILSKWDSALGLDIAPNHTGISIWRDGKLSVYGFCIDESLSVDDVFYYAKVRRFFRSKFNEFFGGMTFQHICVEGCYGGENYTTVKALLNINDVVDDMILDGEVFCENFSRVPETKWMSGCTKITKVVAGLNSKVKIQKILKELGFEFYLENCDKTEKYKKEIFFEDICDAVGITLGVCMLQKLNIPLRSSRSVALSSIKTHYVPYFDDIYKLDKGLAHDVCIYEVIMNTSTIESEIKRLVSEDTDQMYVVRLNTTELGNWGIKRGFKFYPSGDGWLVFYHKDLGV